MLTNPLGWAVVLGFGIAALGLVLRRSAAVVLGLGLASLLGAVLILTTR